MTTARPYVQYSLRGDHVQSLVMPAAVLTAPGFYQQLKWLLCKREVAEQSHLKSSLNIYHRRLNCWLLCKGTGLLNNLDEE